MSRRVFDDLIGAPAAPTWTNRGDHVERPARNGAEYAAALGAERIGGTTTTANGKSGRRSLWGAAAFGLLLALVVFSGLGRGLWTPDEPREAGIAREMLDAPGLVPHLGGEPFLEKPPLYYWIVAGAFALAGPSPAAARAVGALAVFATLLVVWAWGRRAASRFVGRAAALLLALCYGLLSSGHWILIDPTLALWLTLAFWAAWERIDGSRSPGWLALLYGALALALATKGLVGLALPLAGLVPYCALRRAEKPYRALAPWIGLPALAAAAALVMLCFAPSLGFKGIYELFWVNQVMRFLNAPELKGHREPFYAYVALLPAVLLPWLAPLLALLRPKFWRGRGGTERPALRAFFGCVAGGGLLLLSLASSKRNIYLMPLLPPLALALALAMDDWLERRAAAAPRWMLGWLQSGLPALWGVAAPALLLARGDALLRDAPGAPSPGLVATLAASLLLVAVGAAAFTLRATARDERRAAWRGQVVAAAVFAFAMLWVAVPVIDAHKDLTPFLREVDRRLPAGRAVAALGSDETLVGAVSFVCGRRVEPTSAADLARPDGPEFALEQFDPAERKGVVPAGYFVLAERSFGPRRTVRLLHRASPAATPAASPR